MREPIQLFCLPHSGATAQAYLRWTRLLPSWVHVRPIELPGRGARAAEALRTDLMGLARDLAAELPATAGDRYALFGHSVGAALAFELVHALIDGGAPAPMRLFVSASAAPRLRDDRDKALPMSDDDLLRELRRLGGTPHEALHNSELMGLVLPVLRADFLMSGGYVPHQRPPLPCPITALGGMADDVSASAIEAWRTETAADFSMRLLDGGHFFIHEREREALDIVVSDLAAESVARAAA